MPEPPAAPLPVLFVQTSMPVGGAETLLVNLVRGMDRQRFAPEVVCLKEPGPLGEELAAGGYTVHSHLLRSKWDLRVLPRLVRLLRERRIGAVVTVGAGDKMFWGRLAAKIAGTPVVASALHSTGWPDGVGRLNRLLTPITDAFIAVAEPHGRHMVEKERFPQRKVRVIPNGVDTGRFAPLEGSMAIRQEIGVAPTAPLVGILAALRPEKNHELYLDAARRVLAEIPEAVFLVIGDGPRREALERYAREIGVEHAVRFLGNRSDVPEVLAALEVVALTSHNEANPVSILEAMSTGKPVVATDVGSVHRSVIDGQTGWLVAPGDECGLAKRLVELLLDPVLARQMGAAGRRHVASRASLGVMVRGYERLLGELYESKTGRKLPQKASATATRAEPAPQA
ncbi:putative glycosyltransferase EpsF [Pseudobythopirellula maris]|uniref:Putative glycosyltransferase EpsF n=1 Tax=Pseudobythopirellula maris TaxID=2527991 RepID=A0A5C5ZRI2_9BACT|nr:glycosyltransferase [Pseudobythopirellula maris]TWT89695.1 putative glycosyltransferase EpsF [Pseudobythopirellula maris]